MIGAPPRRILSKMPPDDPIQPFQIDAHALRGRLVRLRPAIDKGLEDHR